MYKERMFWDYKKAEKFAKEVGGIIEIKFWNCGQKDYIVTYYEPDKETK